MIAEIIKKGPQLQAHLGPLFKVPLITKIDAEASISEVKALVQKMSELLEDLK